jgi:uncharacterized protein YcnI
MKKSLIVTIMALPVISFAGISSVYAHASLAKKEAKAGKRYKGVMTISHGCKGKPTHTVRIRLPEGVQQTKPMPKPGWKLTVNKEKLAKPYDYHGRMITEEVRELVWSGGNLPNNFFDEFEFRAIMPKEAGKTLYFKTVQECATGFHRWIEIPAPGKTRRDYKSPAPSLLLK